MNTLFCLMLCVTVDWTATPVRLSDVPAGLAAEATLRDGTGTVVFRNRSGHAVPISFDPGALKVVTSRLTDATRTDEPVSIAGVALRTWEPDETRPSVMRPPDPFRLADGATLTVVCDREGAKPVLTAVEGHAPSPLPPDRMYRLVWHDEFDGTALDETKWSYRTNYWGRDAHWFAKPEHGCVEVKDGVVKLKIKKLANGQFVSPQLQTGENMWDLPATGVTNSYWQLPRRRPAKFEHRYGYWECRCKLQAKRDWWSAFWLQSANIGTTLDAADSGAEIDVLECFYPGHVAAHNVFAYGYGPDRKRYETGGGPLENPTDWHTFGVLWDETGYTFYVDGKEDGRVEDCVSKRPLFALISTECRHYRVNRMTGGPAAGLEAAVRANDAFTVDYVRVWEVDRPVASAEAVTVRPKNTDEALINPGMGLVHYSYSSRIWAYDTGLEPGDTLDDLVPGTSVAYLRLPWSYLEPEEGVYRWDILDVKTRPWIAAGKKVAFRIAVMDHTLESIPEWARKAGIKGKRYPYRFRPGAPEWFEPKWDDPVLLAKHEAFLKAFAARWDGNPDVAFVDVGSFGAYGEGHGPSLNDLWRAHDTNELVRLCKIHLDLARRCLPNTYLVVSDDVGGSHNPDPNCPIMAYARSLGIGFRDDSIFCVDPPACWTHAGWARQFAATSPVVVETGHHVRLHKAGGGDFKIEKWFPEKILENAVAYQASYYTVQSFPKHLVRTHAPILKALACRIGYRLELREATFPGRVKAGDPVTIESTWVNVGVAPLYAGASLAWNLVNEKGMVVWSIVDPAFDFKTLAPKLEDGEKPQKVTTRGHFGFTTPVPDNGNDDVLRWARNHPEFDPGTTAELLKPGVYTLAVSVGRKDGKPTISLPLPDGKNRLYPLGKVTVVPRTADGSRIGPARPL